MNVEELLPGYIFCELTDYEREEVEAALARSARLRDELTRYERVFALLAAAAEEDLEAPASLERRIARRVAVKAYVNLANDLLGGLLGAYGRAILYYMSLGD